MTSDAHEGLKKALEKVLAGVSWQRCRVHFMRNMLARVPRGDKPIVAAALRTIFAQLDRQAAGVQLAEVVHGLAGLSGRADICLTTHLADTPQLGD